MAPDWIHGACGWARGAEWRGRGAQAHPGTPSWGGLGHTPSPPPRTPLRPAAPRVQPRPGPPPVVRRVLGRRHHSLNRGNKAILTLGCVPSRSVAFAAPPLGQNKVFVFFTIFTLRDSMYHQGHCYKMRLQDLCNTVVSDPSCRTWHKIFSPAPSGSAVRRRALQNGLRAPVWRSDLSPPAKFITLPPWNAHAHPLARSSCNARNDGVPLSSYYHFLLRSYPFLSISFSFSFPISLPLTPPPLFFARLSVRRRGKGAKPLP